MEQRFDLFVRFIEIRTDPDLAFQRTWLSLRPSRVGERHQLRHGLACLSDDNFLAFRHSLNQA